SGTREMARRKKPPRPCGRGGMCGPRRDGAAGSDHQVAAVEQFLDLALEQRLDAHALLEREVARLFLEQVGVQVELLHMHLGVEDVLLVHVDVDHLVARTDVLGHVVLDRVDLVVDVVLLALDVAGEATHAVVHHHDVRLEALDQVVQRLQRRDHAAGGHVDVCTEGGDAVLRVRLRVGVHRDVALVQVRDHRVGDDFLAGRLLVDHRLLGDEDGHRGTLRVVVLAGHVEDVGADDAGHVGQDLGQAVGVVRLIDVLDVALALVLGDRIADVVDVEAQRLGEVVEALQPQARQGFDHGGHASGGWEARHYGANRVKGGRVFAPGLPPGSGEGTLRHRPTPLFMNARNPAAVSPVRFASSPLSLDQAVIDRFLVHCQRRRYPNRTDVFRPGDPAGTLYYVVNGSVSIIAEEEDGRELVLGYYGPGEFVGEMGLFIETDSREVILRTRAACELAEISYERLQQLMLGALAADAPRLLYSIGVQLSRRLLTTSRKASRLAFLDVTDRIVRTLHDL